MRLPISARDLDRIHWALNSKIRSQMEIYERERDSENQKDETFKENIDELTTIRDKVNKCIVHFKATKWNFGVSRERKNYLYLDDGVNSSYEFMSGEEIAKTAIETKALIPSLETLFQKALDNPDNMHLQFVFHKTLQLGIYKKPEVDQEKFMSEIVGSFIESNISLMEDLLKIKTTTVPPILKVEGLSEL